MTLEEICNPDPEQRRIDSLKRIAQLAKDRVKDAKARAKMRKAQQQQREAIRQRQIAFNHQPSR